MNTIIVHRISNDNQYAKDGGMGSYHSFIQNIIRENAKHSKDGYTLFASDLPLEDKIIFLSHILEAEDYEDALANPIRTQEYIKDHLSLMQQIIDTEIDDVYHDDMREMGMCLNSHSDNGEIYYYRRQI